MARGAKGVVLDEATRRAQADASNPRASAWVSANAGSGKTFVLAQRVVRLLLAGTDPARILCLTFTRAAAAEMAKRVFARLAEWTRLDDDELGKEIEAIEGRRAGPRELAEARRLFARALETPGGLKVQTIHAFCERLLHQFPFEGNVPGHFEMLDEQNQTALAVEARKATIAKAAADRGGLLGEALAEVLAHTSDFGMELAIAELVRKRDRLRTWIVASDGLDRAIEDLRGELGVQPGETPETVEAAILGESLFLGGELAKLHRHLCEGGPKDQQAAKRLGPCVELAEPERRIASYLDFWMTGEKLRVADKIVTKAIKQRWPGLDEMLEREAARLEALLEHRLAVRCLASTAALLRLADAAIGEYERRKRLRGALDFEDLIVKTANLLSRADAAAWVHYKLDRGIDHILVDEAQDTSPRQWQVVKALVEEFFAGRGASEATRTLFAVGDEKQSIFSFQGAVPARFAQVRGELGRQARAAGLGWTEPQLHLSFRSVPPILAAVDKVFGRPPAYAGLSSDGTATMHSASRRAEPGRLILWPQFEPPSRDVPEDWRLPLDYLSEKSPEAKLADRIARTIGGWLSGKEKIDATGKPVRAGSILVLSRNRGAQSDAINRALKSRGIPIAGADRIAVAEHIAVKDLMALGRVMLLPEDDLSLAAVLRSPLIGIGEDDLFAVAHDRPHTLWDALGRAAVEKGGIFAEARGKLDRWRKIADYLDPHAFFARILSEGGRKAIKARLGAEADDVLDEFLAEALSFESANVPSLEGFLAFLVAADTEIRRDTDTLRDEVRVMTVHGAKGLEADIVFLVDTGAAPTHPSHDPKILSLRDDRDGSVSPLVWMRSNRSMPAPVRQRIDDLRELARQEYRRLLYVAMTRARDRLYVCGTRKDRATDDAGGWYALIRDALADELTPVETPEGAALEWRRAERKEARPGKEQTDLKLPPVLPGWLSTPPPPPPLSPKRITPSALSLAEEDETPAFVRRGSYLARTANPESRAALDRGRLVHRLLQSLPELAPEARAAVGERYLAAVAQGWNDGDRRALLAEVTAILADARFAPVFAPGSRAEVDVAGLVALDGGERALAGRIDRLAVTKGGVLIVDYKTNRPAPVRLEDAPAAYLAQLALYQAVLARLYPDLPVRAAILWTDIPALMEIPSSTLAAALANIA
ncbi:MAG TPA: double-strand break repair helicase AddA [Bauldia sp.]|nr:double-strand break repair helicase AddA [Bauldia sp.]